MTDIAKLGFEADTAEMRKASADLDRVTRSAEKLERSARGVETSMSRMERQMGAVGGTMRLLQGAIVGLGLVRMGQSVTNAAIQFQKMETTLKFATGSITGAKTEIEFLRKESERLGQDFLTAGRAYSKLAAAASALGLSTSEIRNTFTGVSAAATVMGLSAYEAEGAFNALQQMLAKGKVQAEELRGQLGERIPTAIADGAAAMGLSTQQLSKALEMGEVDAREFVTKLSDYWVEKFGGQIPKATENANIAITDFGNAVQELQIAVARSGFLEGLTVSMQRIAEILTDPGVMQGAQTFGRAIGDAFVFIADNAETVLRVFAAIGGALKGASLGAAVGGPQGALFGALLGGGAGALSPDILGAIFSSAEEATVSVEDLRGTVGDLEDQLKTAEADLKAYGTAAHGVAADVERIKLALLDARQALDTFNSGMGDDEFLGGMAGVGTAFAATIAAVKTGTTEYTKAQEGAIGKLREQAALLGVTGVALARVNALTDTGAASLTDAIKIAQGDLAVTTDRQRAVLELVDAIEADTLARERNAEALKAEQDALLDEEQAAEAAADRLEDLRRSKSRLITETERQIADNRELNGIQAQGSREVEIYTEAQRLMRQNVLLSAEAARKLATDLVDSERELDRTRKTIAAFEGLFDQAFDRIGEAITQAFATGEISAIRFGDIAKSVLSEVIQFALKLSVINPLKNALSGANLPTFGAGGGAAGGGGGFGNIISSLGSGLDSLLGGGPSGIANTIANSSLGTTLGLSTSASTTAATSIGGAAGEIAAGASSAGGLTGAGSALVTAAPYIAAAAAVAMIALQSGVIGPGPTSGPVSIGDFSPGRGRDGQYDVDGIDTYTADNGGNPESVRPIVEAVAELIASVAEEFEADILSDLRFRIAEYGGPEAGNSKNRVAGIEVNAFIRGEAEARIAEGLDATQAIFEAFNFAVKEAFTFESATLNEIARTTSAETTEELLADLEFGRTFDRLRSGIEALGGNISANTVAQVLNTQAIKDRAEESVRASLAPIKDFIERAVALFPAVEGAASTGSGAGLSVDTSGLMLETDNGAVRGNTPEFSYRNSGNEYGPVGTFSAGDQAFDLAQVSSDSSRSGTVFALLNAAGETVAEFDSVAAALAGAGEALSEYSAAVVASEAALGRTAEEQARYDANLERVGFAIGVVKAQVDGLFDSITGAGDDIERGPFATALETGNAQITALGEELATVNEQITAANEAFPELSAALIDIEAATTAASAALLETLQSDFLASIQSQINTADGNGFLNTLDGLLDQRGVNASDAAALGLNVNDTAGELFSSQISSVLGGLDLEQLQSVVSTFTDAALVDAAQDLIDALSATANAQTATTAEAILQEMAIEDLIEAELLLVQTRREEATEARRLANQAGQNTRSLRSAANGFQTNSSLSTLSVEDQMVEALRQFDEAYAVANDNTPGDAESQDAIQRLPGLGQTALETAKAFYGSSTQYAARSQTIRDRLLATASAQETIEQQQLTVLQSIEALLEAGGANDNGQPRYVSAGNGQYVSTGAGGLPAGLDLGSRPDDNFRIARAFAAAGISFPGAGEGQLTSLRQSNSLADSLLTAMGFANGGVFSSGNVIPFAKGGVVNRTTMFSMGMMGEAGPEAIMPLERGTDGSLGVKSNGRDERMMFMLVERFERMEALLERIASNTAASAAEARKSNIRARAA